jgi:hypothetical protein
MNVEQLDGFFAALIAGPETVMPSEYYPEVFGGDMSHACEFGSIDEANEILGFGIDDATLEGHRLDPVQGQGLRAAPATGRERRGSWQ